MDNVQRIDLNNTAPSSKTFRDELRRSIVHYAHPTEKGTLVRKARVVYIVKILFYGRRCKIKSNFRKVN
jgi:hypothetical protein